jgi:hypothetical protein
MASTDRALIEAEKQVQSLQSRWKSAQLAHKHQIDRGMEAGTSAALAFAGGYAEARYPERAKIMGVETTIVLGGAAAIAGISDALPHSNLVAAAGVGLLCAGLSQRGRTMGNDALQKAQAKG